jgi:hypothetical protein
MISDLDAYRAAKLLMDQRGEERPPLAAGRVYSATRGGWPAEFAARGYESAEDARQ